MSEPGTFLFAGGGTGGHLFPGIAVADELRKREPLSRVVFIGSTRSIESTIMSEHRLEHRMLPVESLSMLKQNPFRFAVRNWKAWQLAKRLLRELRPSAVLGLGGYASAPIVLAAYRLRIPVVLIEPNLIPGRATRWLSRCATCICMSFAETAPRLKHARRLIVTGNPVRAEIAALVDRPLAVSAEADREIDPDRSRELLVLGGSQGADTLNEAVLDAVEKNADALRHWKIVHQTGPRHVDRVRDAYRKQGLDSDVQPFFHDLPNRYSSASFAISRAGATTLAELACAGTGMILLPFPHAADNHQRANAIAFCSSGAAMMIEHQSDPAQTANELSIVLRQLLENADRRQAMCLSARKLAHPGATVQIANLVLEAVTGQKPADRTES